MVVRPEELVGFFDLRGSKIVDLANRRPVIRMVAGKKRREHRHRREPVGPVFVVLTPLVEHHITLGRELLRSQRRQQISHPVRFHPERELERAGGHDLPVIRAIGVRRPVERRARGLQRLEEPAVVVLGALEHQMLEEVREAGVPRPFVFGSDVIPDVDRDDRTPVRFVQQHVEAVGERVLAERNIHS